MQFSAFVSQRIHAEYRDFVTLMRQKNTETVLRSARDIVTAMDIVKFVDKYNIEIDNASQHRKRQLMESGNMLCTFLDAVDNDTGFANDGDSSKAIKKWLGD